MPQVTFVHPDGKRQDVAARAGISVMRAAIEQNVPGIEAECGGACACGTCHVYIDGDDLARVPAALAPEQEMLQAVADELRPASRLSCQIKLSDALEGLVVHLPQKQY